MIPNLYIGIGCFTKHLFINGCLGFQVMVNCWFGARWFGSLGVPRIPIPFIFRDSIGIQTTNYPNQQFTTSWQNQERKTTHSKNRWVSSSVRSVSWISLIKTKAKHLADSLTSIANSPGLSIQLGEVISITLTLAKRGPVQQVWLPKETVGTLEFS